MILDKSPLWASFLGIKTSFYFCTKPSVVLILQEHDPVQCVGLGFWSCNQNDSPKRPFDAYENTEKWQGRALNILAKLFACETKAGKSTDADINVPTYVSAWGH